MVFTKFSRQFFPGGVPGGSDGKASAYSVGDLGSIPGSGRYSGEGNGCFFDNPADVGNLISGSSAFSKTSLSLWKFMVHVLLKPGLENFENYFTRV